MLKIKKWSGLTVIGMALMLRCSVPESQNQIIAWIGDREITLLDFKNRSEFTVRPAYCAGNSNRDKSIIVNSLIAEKIFALEAQKDSVITHNQKLRQYVTGIKEQKMREMHFKQLALNKVEISEEMVDEVSAVANRTYTLEYFDVSANEAVDSIARLLESDRSQFRTVFNKLYPAKILPKQTIKWLDVFHPDLYEKLYFQRAEPGEVIGPVYRDDGRIFFFRVEEWLSKINFAEIEQKLIRQQVHQQLRLKKGLQAYEAIIQKIMQGKKLVFNREGLIAFTNRLGSVYFPDYSNYNYLQQMDPLRRWQQEARLDSIFNSSAELKQKEILQIDHHSWTVGDLLSEMEKHPLVFHKKNFPPKEFGEQLKLAVVDLVRDHYITREAYRGSFDQNAEAVKTERHWQDYFYAVLEREKVLQTTQDSTVDKFDYLDRYVRNLKEQYKAKIKINREMILNAEINMIQTMAIERNAPFPMVSPGFPVLTSDDVL